MLFYRDSEKADPFSRIYGHPQWLFPYELPLPEFPLMIDMEITNHCNLDCIFCSRQLMSRKQGVMDFGVFTKIIDEVAPYGTGIRISGWGEPFLHPRVVEMAEYAHAKEVTVQVTTNATIMSEERAERIVRSGLDELRFSMQGLNKHHYEEMRLRGRFEQFVHNVKLVHAVRERLGARTPFLTMQTTVLTTDWAEKTPEEYRDEWLPYVDKVSVDNTFFTYVEHLERVKRYLPHQGFEQQYGPCVDIAIKMFINWQGTVQWCVQDYEGVLHALGNVREMSIREAWHHERLERQRERVGRNLEHASLPFCKKCYSVTTKYEELKEKAREGGAAPVAVAVQQGGAA